MQVKEEIIYDIHGEVTIMDVVNVIAEDYGLSPLAKYRLQRLITVQVAPDTRPIISIQEGSQRVLPVNFDIKLNDIHLKTSISIDVYSTNVNIFALIDSLLRDTGIGTESISFLKWRKAMLFQILQSFYILAEAAQTRLAPPDSAVTPTPFYIGVSK